MQMSLQACARTLFNKLSTDRLFSWEFELLTLPSAVQSLTHRGTTLEITLD